MRKTRWLIRAIIVALAASSLAANAQQIGKYVPIQAGSDVDHALNEINATADPAQKLALLQKFADGIGKAGDYPLVAEGLFVDYYLGQKNYDKVFEYGEKVFVLDPHNFQNALSLVRAAAEKGDVDRLSAYGEKAGGIVQWYKAAPPPAGTAAGVWEEEKNRALEANKDSFTYVQQLVFTGVYKETNPAKRAVLLVKFAESFPDSVFTSQALGVAATSYQQAQNAPKMLEVANGVLAKDPDNVGMLLLLSDYYCDKADQVDKAGTYAKKVISLLDTAQKPEGTTEEQWTQQKALQKGLALSSLGQVNIEKKDNAQAVENLKAAAPLVKADDGSYARNQYRLGFALLNLKRNAEAKEAFTEAASVNSPYKGPAQEKLKGLAGPARKKAS
jgi:tetratricopeptide (TPR) repeat protein